MEDEHTNILELDDGSEDKNTLFAVYDGHGGKVFFSYVISCLTLTSLSKGGAASKFAAQTVHKQLVMEESYHLKKYEIALKRAFLDTDEELRNGKSLILCFDDVFLSCLLDAQTLGFKGTDREPPL
jgi:protein phosphatase 2C family protein 2/3